VTPASRRHHRPPVELYQACGDARGLLRQIHTYIDFIGEGQGTRELGERLRLAEAEADTERKVIADPRARVAQPPPPQPRGHAEDRLRSGGPAHGGPGEGARAAPHGLQVLPSATIRGKTSSPKGKGIGCEEAGVRLSWRVSSGTVPAAQPPTA